MVGFFHQVQCVVHVKKEVRGGCRWRLSGVRDCLSIQILNKSRLITPSLVGYKLLKNQKD